MKKSTVTTMAIACVLLTPTAFAWALDQETEQQVRVQEQQERIYGSQLMSEQERTEYRARIRAAKTTEEQNEIRAEHHERMRVRAQEQGLELPEMIPPGGGGAMRSLGVGGVGRGGGHGGGNGGKR